MGGTSLSYISPLENPSVSAANANGNFTTSCARIRDPTTGNLVGFSRSDNANALNCPGDFRIYARAWRLSRRYSRQRSGNGRLIASVTIYANSSRRPFSRAWFCRETSRQCRARTSRNDSRQCREPALQLNENELRYSVFDHYFNNRE